MPRNDVLHTPAGPPWMLSRSGSFSPVLYDAGSHKRPSTVWPSLLFHVIGRICETPICLNQAFASVMVVTWPLLVSTIAISAGDEGVERVPATRFRSRDAEEADRLMSPAASERGWPVVRSSS